MKFFLKQIVGALAAPLTLAVILGIAALICWRWRRRVAMALAAGAVAVAYAWFASGGRQRLARAARAPCTKLPDDLDPNRVYAIVVLEECLYAPRQTSPSRQPSTRMG